MFRLFALAQINDDNVIFQQYDVPAHYADLAKDFVDEIFPQGWMESGGLEPPHSSDLTQMDFCF